MTNKWRTLLTGVIVSLGGTTFLAESINAQESVPARTRVGTVAQGPPGSGAARVPVNPRKQVLVLGQTRGFYHTSTPAGMVAFYDLGLSNGGVWDSYLRTETEMITKKKGPARNLSFFDAVVFVNTSGTLDLDDDQKRDLLSFVHDDGKGFVAVHGTLDANYQWPEWAEMVGGWFDGHPWNTSFASIVIEDPWFPAVCHFPRAFSKRDEFYLARNWSRDKVNVVMRMDETKLDYTGREKRVRPDHDFAVAWAKMYGKGRVFYSTLGQTEESWLDEDIRRMYFEAMRWVLGLTEGSVAPHPKPAN